MKTVTEISRLTCVSIRTLHHYDAIGLLKPTAVTGAGYRLYDDAALERLYLILVYRELDFPLKQIGEILDAPDYDRRRILDEQIQLLQARVTHLQNRIHFANGLKLRGAANMSWKDFDPNKIDDYSTQAQTLYGKTEAWQEYTKKSKGRSRQQELELGGEMMEHFVRLGQMKDLAPDSPAVQDWVRSLQSFITEHYYPCTPQILSCLGQMYAGGGSMTENIDKAGGDGTAALACAAIEVYCGK